MNDRDVELQALGLSEDTEPAVRARRLAFFRICVLAVEAVPQCLREFFRKRWQSKYKLVWGIPDAETSANALLDGSELTSPHVLPLPKSFYKGFEYVLPKLKSGELQSWDVTLLSSVLLNSPGLLDPSALNGWKCDKSECTSEKKDPCNQVVHWPECANKAIKMFRNMRNTNFGHLGNAEAPDSVVESFKDTIRCFCSEYDVECPAMIAKLDSISTGECLDVMPKLCEQLKSRCTIGLDELNDNTADAATEHRLWKLHKALNRFLEEISELQDPPTEGRSPSTKSNVITKVRVRIQDCIDDLFKEMMSECAPYTKSKSSRSLDGNLEAIAAEASCCANSSPSSPEGGTGNDTDQSRAGTPRRYPSDDSVAALYVHDHSEDNWRADMRALLQDMLQKDRLTPCALALAAAINATTFPNPDGRAYWNGLVDSKCKDDISATKRELELFAEADVLVRDGDLECPEIAPAVSEWQGISTAELAAQRSAAAAAAAMPRLRVDHGGVQLVDGFVRSLIRGSSLNLRWWNREVISPVNDAAAASAPGDDGDGGVGASGAGGDRLVALFLEKANQVLTKITLDGTKFVKVISTQSYVMFVRLSPAAAALLHTYLTTDPATAAAAAKPGGIGLAAFGCEGLGVLRLRRPTAATAAVFESVREPEAGRISDRLQVVAAVLEAMQSSYEVPGLCVV